MVRHDRKIKVAAGLGTRRLKPPMDMEIIKCKAGARLTAYKSLFLRLTLNLKILKPPLDTAADATYCSSDLHGAQKDFSGRYGHCASKEKPL